MISLFSLTATPDGYSSSAMIINYMKMMDKEYPVAYMLHRRNKAHGLADMDFEIPENTKLLIIPDAATNDVEACNSLIEQGIDIIILDHHLQNNSGDINKAIIVNNQMSDNYPNKDFCGAGVVHEFLRALDEHFWQEYASDFLDLAAFANISDIMDLRNHTTRYCVEYGLANIQSNMLQAMIKAQDYSMNGEVNVHNISWYITTILNGMIRTGSLEERDLVFRAFINDYEEFDYKKRSGEVIKENIYDRAVRLCKNAKSKQDRIRDKLFEELKDKVNSTDKIAMVIVENDYNGLLGLGAMRLADYIGRPTIVLKEIEKNGQKILSGSGRNFNNSPIDSLKDIVDSTGLFSLCAGHDNANGIQIIPENFEQAKITFNEMLKDITYDASYRCDFIIDCDDFDVTLVNNIHNLRWLWCTGISEPNIAVENIYVTRDDITVQGKNHDSITFEVNGIKFVQFKLQDGDPIYDFVNDWGEDDDEIVLNVVGTCNINNFRGEIIPQFIIKDCNTVRNYLW